MITLDEKNLIRELAKKIKDLSQLPIMEERRSDWYAHNDLKSNKPMLLVFPEGGWHEIIPPDMLECEDELAREMEWKLRARIFRTQNINDDSAVEPVWEVNKIITDTGWGMRQEGEDVNPVGNVFEIDSTIGYMPQTWKKGFSFNEKAMPFNPVIEEPSDLNKIQMPKVNYDENTTLERFKIQQDILGDILDVSLIGKKYVFFNMMEMYTGLRGLQNVLYDFYEEPEMTHEAMDIFEEGFKNVIKQYREMKLLELNNDHTYVGTGGNGYTHELPKNDKGADDLSNLWACAEAQELTNVSPEMTEEFVLKHERRLLEPFGMAAYGCCEVIENKIPYVMKAPNMRRVSVSPWSDIELCAERLGNKAIYSWKPNPSLFINNFDEERLGEYVKKMLRATENNVPEIILKDTHTCQNDPNRYRRWTDLCRKAIKEIRGIG